ncbi:hypothetical protein B9Z55_021453 [Caenorhabditis nigoni]|uniref:Very-long-chain (3R)-3-hydroxyacyl-CoA dehydratase n=1 Tax=Caenorhabditis nigoni TaxID=1611254 RepID=A0A2G5TS72_9PELO|nr:hypothetical protein B9Z55_021453 [Caenorhabditis nigoni]
MRLLLITLIILHNLPLKNANSIYEVIQPEPRIAKRDQKMWVETGTPDPNRTDIRFLFHSSIYGFKNPKFIQNISDFLLDNEFSTFNFVKEATNDILENSENFSNFPEKPTLWIIDFQSKDYAKIFPQFEIRQQSCDEFEFFENFGKNRYFQKFDLFLLETYSPCGLKFYNGISKKIEFMSRTLSRRWKFFDVVFEADETTDYTYSPDPEYREELSNLKNMKRQRYFQNKYMNALHELAWICPFLYVPAEFFAVLFVAFRWVWWGSADEDNVYYVLRRCFDVFVISDAVRKVHVYLFIAHFAQIGVYLVSQRNWNYFFQQLMAFEMVYTVGKYIVDDSRKIVWPLILASEILELSHALKFRTTEFLPFELQMLKILRTLHDFILLNQYPQFSVLIWLIVIAYLQIFSFVFYFRFPPLTWTVPILDIAPTHVPKNPKMIYTRYVAFGGF